MKPPPRPRLHVPSPGRQGVRLAPQFEALRQTLEARRAELTEATSAADPELVAVFDLAGSVDGFFRAVAKVEGLEFLAELEEDYVDADNDFFYEDQGEPSGTGVAESLYMVMSNVQAVTELVRLFELWQADPRLTLPRGLAPLKEVFASLRSLRRWGSEDRVRETGLLAAWAEDVAVAGAQGSARVEIELWYRSDQARRAVAQAEVTRLVQAVGGEVITTAVIDSVDYHGVLADIPYNQVERVLADGPDAIELLRTDTIMLVGPARPMAFPVLAVLDQTYPPILGPIVDGPPRLALLDGVPFANHAALTGRLVIDDPDDRAARYVTDQQSHGTAMASLIAHGDLSAPGPALSRPIYVRPIMEPHPLNRNVEVIPRDQILVDLLHRSFRRMFEPDGTQPPAAPSVRIVNLSIGDPARVFARRLSPLAKLLDWLAHRYNLVVVVSAGNHFSAPVVPAAALDDSAALQAAAATSLHGQARQRRLLAPAEAVNVVTVGALHADGADTTAVNTVVDAIATGMPAAYSPVGFGYRRSVKPEILLPGGRGLYLRPPPNAEGDVTLQAAQTAGRGPGLLVAAPSLAGTVTGVAFTTGTSNAAALASRVAHQIFDVLDDLHPSDGEFAFPDAQYHPVLAKTLLVHAAGWGTLRNSLRETLGLSGTNARRDLTQLLGYGPLREERVASAERTRVVLLGAGSITAGIQHLYSFPLPPALAATTEWRRLTVTLGWLSQVNTRSQKHRMARLWFQPPRDELRVDPVEAYHHAVRKGTVQHQVLEGRDAVAFTADDALTVEIDCRVDAGKLSAPVRYGLAASVEVAATVNADIHAQVRQALRVQLRQRITDRNGP